MNERFLAWPGRSLRETLPLCATFAALFGILYSGASWITGHYASLPAWNLPFELRIPFVPAACLVYLTITPVLLLAPLVFRTRDELVPLFTTLCIETIVATCGFLLFPQTTAWHRPPVGGWLHLPFTVADTLNLSYNQFPSLHVAFATTAAWAYGRRVAIIPRLAWLGWAIAVAASTVLMWEHHLVDVAGGVALAWAAVRFVYLPLERAEVREHVAVELFCLESCARFSLRHRRYFVIFLAIWGPSLLQWRRYRAVRTGFCAAQSIDDLLDGDRRSDREPLAVVDDLLREIQSGQWSSSALSRITRAFVDELTTIDPTRRSLAQFVELVRTMQRDRRRVLAAEVWSDEQLRTHHRRTFTLSLDLMLTAARCTTRSDAAPALVDALGWCSTFRDLHDDLRAGIINVPDAVWNTMDGPLETSAAYRAWVRDSHAQACSTLAASALHVRQIGEPRARTILGVFQRSVEKFARKVPRRFRESFD